MKKDKKHYIDNLTCYVTRVKSLDVCEPLRPGLPQVMMQHHAELPPIPPVKAQDSVPGPGALIARGNDDIASAPSHRRSSASSFMSCLADSDLLSIQGSEADEVVEADVESEHEESTVFDNRGTMEDSAAVRQWLRDHGSPEHGKVSFCQSLLTMSCGPYHVSRVFFDRTPNIFDCYIMATCW